MDAVRIDKFVHTYNEIKVSNVAIPQRKNDEVLVTIFAAGVNFVDLLYRRSVFPVVPGGKHQNNRSLVLPPFTLGLEFAGVVDSSPPGCSFKPGDHVFGGSLGSYASRISVKPSVLHHIPSKWSFAEAAGLAATVPVSYGALIMRGNIRPGETVLIHAAAGGLGLMAVQIAKARGCTVIATAGCGFKLEVARKYGADHTFNYKDPVWFKHVLDVTNGNGVDAVFDPVGLVDKSLKCLKQKGRILIVGFAGNIEQIGTNRVLLKQAVLIGYRFGETERQDPAETVGIWKGLREMIDKDLIKPTVYDKEYTGLESVPEAMTDLSDRKVWGKAIIKVTHDVKARM
ncbi:NAD(P)-binding Rossmann-fold containing protein [Glarea lozoyensis ATCC 20868]|uniref:NAD(P)-binding Rossmann-fold containing protein n=1 Tax=Glarea lozoyensis (strain ATCC 20868 / MF5171) TaxID=1116229 RepID=S3DU93_GLAL2|nr:NAD(P)-binding Rossmann-fold containing protein [Glarea lozoyensis ATCC 20868]EPE35531.1 NAD(P)-binding Rossmann-fold containing protein [Glarea lozoyensis ATCC 20868]